MKRNANSMRGRLKPYQPIEQLTRDRLFFFLVYETEDVISLDV